MVQRLDIAYKKLSEIEDMTTTEDVEKGFSELKSRIKKLEARAKKIDSNIRKMMKLLEGD